MRVLCFLVIKYIQIFFAVLTNLFLQNCDRLDLDEDYELRLWMLNLVAYYLAENENWFAIADDSKYWGKLFLSEEDWEVPPPSWAIAREKNSEEYRSWVEEERQKLLEVEEENVETKESLVTNSPFDLDWGAGVEQP